MRLHRICENVQEIALLEIDHIFLVTTFDDRTTHLQRSTGIVKNRKRLQYGSKLKRMFINHNHDTCIISS